VHVTTKKYKIALLQTLIGCMFDPMQWQRHC